jgi:endonuclease YncB( thermonuclease family)
MTRTLAALLLSLAPTLYAAQSAAGEREPHLRALDGDTLAFATERLRLVGIDAPELRCRCPSECDAAQAATEALRRLIEEAATVVVVRTGIDRYGRSLGRVEADGVDVGEALVAMGHARVWTGRREPWC